MPEFGRIAVRARRERLPVVLRVVLSFCVAIVGSNIVGADSPPPQRYAGKVVNTNGAAISDVEVLCEVLANDPRDRAILSSRSEADGSFKLSFESGLVLSNHLWIRSPEYALQRCSLSDFRRINDERPLRTVTVKRTAPVRFRVIGPDGRPCAGELVEPEMIAVERLVYPVPPRLREILGGVTDENGTWVANFVDESSSLSVRVISETYGLQLQEHRFGTAARERTLKLLPVGSIAGRIVTDDPGRFAGRTVSVQSSLKRPEEDVLIAGALGPGVGQSVDFERGEATAQIDREGRFQIPGITAGEVTVTLTGPPDPEWVTEVRKSYTLKAGENREIAIPAVRTVWFGGKILLNDGGPAEGVRLELSSGANWPVVNVTTDAAGEFKCRVCPGDVSLKGNLTSYRKVTVFPGASVKGVTRGVGSDPAAATAETLSLPALELVEGVVRDKAGKAVPAAGVNIWQYPGSAQTVAADRDGRFRIYRTKETVFNQFGVMMNGQSKVSREEKGEPLVVRLLE